MLKKKKCKATIVFGDDFGDNCTTFHCQLEKGHKGYHREKGDMGYTIKRIPYVIRWKGDSETLFDDIEKELKSRQNKKFGVNI